MGYHRKMKNIISENNSRMFSSSREVDRCIFCGGHKEVAKKNFTIQFSEFEFNKGSICVDCYSANTRSSITVIG